MKKEIEFGNHIGERQIRDIEHLPREEFDKRLNFARRQMPGVSDEDLIEILRMAPLDAATASEIRRQQTNEYLQKFERQIAESQKALQECLPERKAELVGGFKKVKRLVTEERKNPNNKLKKILGLGNNKKHETEIPPQEPGLPPFLKGRPIPPSFEQTRKEYLSVKRQLRPGLIKKEQKAARGLEESKSCRLTDLKISDTKGEKSHQEWINARSIIFGKGK